MPSSGVRFLRKNVSTSLDDQVRLLTRYGIVFPPLTVILWPATNLQHREPKTPPWPNVVKLAHSS